MVEEAANQGRILTLLWQTKRHMSESAGKALDESGKTNYRTCIAERSTTPVPHCG